MIDLKDMFGKSVGEAVEKMSSNKIKYPIFIGSEEEILAFHDIVSKVGNIIFKEKVRSMQEYMSNQDEIDLVMSEIKPLTNDANDLKNSIGKTSYRDKIIDPYSKIMIDFDNINRVKLVYEHIDLYIEEERKLLKSKDSNIDLHAERVTYSNKLKKRLKKLINNTSDIEAEKEIEEEDAE